jgi:hypothetical protein
MREAEQAARRIELAAGGERAQSLPDGDAERYDECITDRGELRGEDGAHDVAERRL